MITLFHNHDAIVSLDSMPRIPVTDELILFHQKKFESITSWKVVSVLHSIDGRSQNVIKDEFLTNVEIHVTPYSFK